MQMLCILSPLSSNCLCLTLHAFDFMFVFMEVREICQDVKVTLISEVAMLVQARHTNSVCLQCSGLAVVQWISCSPKFLGYMY